MAPWKSIHTFFVSALLMWIVLGSTSLVFNAYHVGNVCVCFDHFVIDIESACGQGVAFVLSYLDRVGGALILLS